MALNGFPDALSCCNNQGTSSLPLPGGAALNDETHVVAHSANREVLHMQAERVIPPTLNHLAGPSNAPNEFTVSRQIPTRSGPRPGPSRQGLRWRNGRGFRSPGEHLPWRTPAGPPVTTGRVPRRGVGSSPGESITTRKKRAAQTSAELQVTPAGSLSSSPRVPSSREMSATDAPDRRKRSSSARREPGQRQVIAELHDLHPKPPGFVQQAKGVHWLAGAMPGTPIAHANV